MASPYRRDGITLAHPATLVATWLGAGLLPRAPGTWGSAAALPFAWLLVGWGGAWALGAATVVVTLAGWWAAAVYVRRTGVADPGEIVVDEVAGQWLVLLFVPADPLLYALGFVVFRVLDIWKPWPAGWADRHIEGGFGVMADDLLAALYGTAIMAAATLAWR
ncbi:MAG: phosphatidylglycerophosphatase A [Solirubrobacterales bacterium]